MLSQNLCYDIEKKIGHDKFKSEAYIHKLDGMKSWESTAAKMHHAWKKTVGYTISGEWKLAITLQMLSGSTYLSMYLWSNISTSEVNNIFNVVTRDWICKTLVIDFYNDVLGNENNISKITSNFATTSDGVMDGCIGAIDGWLVCIRCPALSEVRNPGKYFARKGFYAVNVQVISDRNKKVLWRAIGQIGSIHDSRAFAISNLYTYLKSATNSILRIGVYLVGDSAYAIRPFLLTPYDNADPLTKEDTFNYFLSRNRIYVECIFGEICRRWGIFWKPLEGSLERHQYTIDAALKLHNYIVDYRMEENEDANEIDEEDELQAMRNDF